MKHLKVKFLCRENELDGLVVEIWSQLGGQARYFPIRNDCLLYTIGKTSITKSDEIWKKIPFFSKKSRPQLVQLLGRLASAMHDEGLLFVLVIPPPVYQVDIKGGGNLCPDIQLFREWIYDFLCFTQNQWTLLLDHIFTCFQYWMPAIAIEKNLNNILGEKEEHWNFKLYIF